MGISSGYDAKTIQFRYKSKCSAWRRRGPANTLSCARTLVDASFTDIVSPNSDTLYCIIQFDLKKEPIVFVVPPIDADRYYTFQFLDAYTNDFAYVGTRATGSNGGTYLIAGPNCVE